ncbi:hypothetical protein CSKR_103994 [Clonorchis sinensis]|uniref:Uncharacterized protein n=2 Tax=Clonorchis sinensis TaxID=79923 RepID=G7YTK0_CLOSI|nr:hypothetical protein CSKR_103994 [Clonorchis sinensis]GAA56280.1 hypothetical protein CLF_110499 [Clonorchis sinensis]
MRRIEVYTTNRRLTDLILACLTQQHDLKQLTTPVIEDFHLELIGTTGVSYYRIRLVYIESRYPRAKLKSNALSKVTLANGDERSEPMTIATLCGAEIFLNCKDEQRLQKFDCNGYNPV